jgi:putative DNA methylase
MMSRLIESDQFPFEFLSVIGERESWRKEIHRPIYHLHKWWAKRLGSTFRGILLSSILPSDSDLEREFYARHALSGTVLDPFMGSGTTIGEAHKLGLTALGRDINPVACEAVRVSLGSLDRFSIQREFERLESAVGRRITQLYRTTDSQGSPADILYVFWVKQVACTGCGTHIDLFPTYIFAKNAYVGRKPGVHIVCPTCSHVFAGEYNASIVACPSCASKFNPHKGPAAGASATCATCSTSFKIIDAVRRRNNPPLHRMYAKLVLRADGEKEYLPVSSEDIRAYENASAILKSEEDADAIRLPTARLLDGFNTRQALNYNYCTWREFFNDRQLLALAWLQREIASIVDPGTRDAFMTLFSGVLEFNNVFTSYKGEGTGAVRHMFAHHILKPERMPIEGNPWGTPRSSGAFSTLYRSRLIRALDYRLAPRELDEGSSSKTSSPPFSGVVHDHWPTDGHGESRGIYLSCGSSDSLQLPSRSIDLVVTDPPFFDNVHYSELADFFAAWQSLYPHGFFMKPTETTRDRREVQDADADAFSAKLEQVFTECQRVLKDDGLLVFSYHHSRPEGWEALAAAIYGSGFQVVNAHPVKSEMSVAVPKLQAKEPIQLDIILVCAKTRRDASGECAPLDLPDLFVSATAKAHRLETIGLSVSHNDFRIIVYSELLKRLGAVSAADAIAILQRTREHIDNALKTPELTQHESSARAGLPAEAPVEPLLF